MSRIIILIMAFWTLAVPSLAQDFSGLARIRPEESRIAETSRGGLRLDLALSQGVPFRLFTLDEPRRLVLDFQEVDWTGLSAEVLLVEDRVVSAQFGTYVPGWSRMVLELARPYSVAEAAMSVDAVTGGARLGVVLKPVDEATYAASAGAPYDPRWDLPVPEQLPALPERGPDAPVRVVLDPGHGGIDPGAEVEGVVEKELMLRFAREVQDLLLRTGGFEVVLTRDADVFVSLERRIALAHEAGADVFISLHADSLSEGLAHGATVHVLAEEASDIASAKLAERHDRDDLLAGVDLSDADDRVTDVLLDLARQETRPRTEALARALVDGMTQQGGPMNRRPLRGASFSVLKAADIPSVLVEIGFLSSPRDLKNLQDPEWRAAMAAGIRNGLVNWRKMDIENRALVRQ
ncbi:N-acetylmuramoyl-L-alanine amidase [Ruegeria sp. PrR005]|uniref:N-acetylmuramoyl-L-alanine amidase n=1 Tax=Ruegeria sp. PrR005 TaxID=2706882 RepID=A0A6B2NL17_9RHOB|nr:N-acetylmuramoyl-L-alanine amidase [Ruegeria sp. PrR005]NDW43693.1 N-acetylmuramoyl-L-alanine amidase [Ruegeria sp. PrR005]